MRKILWYVFALLIAGVLVTVAYQINTQRNRGGSSAVSTPVSGQDSKGISDDAYRNLNLNK